MTQRDEMTAMSAHLSQPPDPLLSSVLALLKAAGEEHCSVNRTKLAKLLYFADLRAVEDGGSPFTGATWRWRDHGPYDNALRRAEDALVLTELATRHNDIGERAYGACTLRLAIADIADPLPPQQMEIVRAVVREYGRKRATTLRNLSYETPPMIEAQAAGAHEVILNLNRARRAKQARELLARHGRQRSAQHTRARDKGVEDELIGEHEAMTDLRRTATSKVLGDDG